MAIISAKCPHCGLENSNFQVIGVHVKPLKANETDSNDKRHVSAGAVCTRCFLPIAVILISNDVVSHSQCSSRAREYFGSSYAQHHYRFNIHRLWPELQPPRIPDHLDARVERALLQAESNFAIVGNEEAAGMMYRRALEVALDLRYPNVPGMLRAKIKALVAKGDLLPTLGEWADQVRVLGNDAAHEADGLTRNDLVAMREFTDAVLRYAVSLPQEIETRKAATSPPAGAN